MVYFSKTMIFMDIEETFIILINLYSHYYFSG